GARAALVAVRAPSVPMPIQPKSMLTPAVVFTSTWRPSTAWSFQGFPRLEHHIPKGRRQEAGALLVPGFEDFFCGVCLIFRILPEAMRVRSLLAVLKAQPIDRSRTRLVHDPADHGAAIRPVASGSCPHIVEDVDRKLFGALSALHYPQRRVRQSQDRLRPTEHRR